MRVIISLCAAVAAYRLINDFRLSWFGIELCTGGVLLRFHNKIIS